MNSLEIVKSWLSQHKFLEASRLAKLIGVGNFAARQELRQITEQLPQDTMAVVVERREGGFFTERKPINELQAQDSIWALYIGELNDAMILTEQATRRAEINAGNQDGLYYNTSAEVGIHPQSFRKGTSVCGVQARNTTFDSSRRQPATLDKFTSKPAPTAPQEPKQQAQPSINTFVSKQPPPKPKEIKFDKEYSQEPKKLARQSTPHPLKSKRKSSQKQLMSEMITNQSLYSIEEDDNKMQIDQEEECQEQQNQGKRKKPNAVLVENAKTKMIRVKETVTRTDAKGRLISEDVWVNKEVPVENGRALHKGNGTQTSLAAFMRSQLNINQL